MMYTGVHSGRFTEVFSDYYSKMPDMLIVKAYLSYNAQLYLIRQKKANDIVFRVIEECMEDGTGLPECCYVAWLKNISKNTNVLEDEKRKSMRRIFLMNYVLMTEYMHFIRNLTVYWTCHIMYLELQC